MGLSIHKSCCTPAQFEVLVSTCLPCTPMETETFSCEILAETMQIVLGFSSGKKNKTSQGKTKPNQRCSAGKTSGNARKSDCSYRVLCVPRLPRQRQLSSICRIFQFWRKLDFKQVPFSCRCILKIGLTLSVPPIKESIRSSQWN